MYVVSKYKNPLLGVVAFSTGVQTSLHSSPMLRINCLMSHKLIATSRPPEPTPTITHIHTCDTIQNSRRRHRHLGILLAPMLCILVKREDLGMIRMLKYNSPHWKRLSHDSFWLLFWTIEWVCRIKASRGTAADCLYSFNGLLILVILSLFHSRIAA